MTGEQSLSDAEVAALVAALDDEWVVATAERADAGHLPVYHLTVHGPGAPGECVLKAGPGEDHDVLSEAQLLALVAAETTIPVPAVLGVVREHAAAPGGAFLMAEAPGTQVLPEEAPTLAGAAAERFARDAGRHLAALHDLDDVDGYGYVAVDDERDAPAGGRRGAPPVDPAATHVEPLQGADPAGSWPAVLDAWAEDTLAGHADTEFGDLTPAVRDALAARLDDLSGEFSPALGRVDHGLHNVLLDPESGETTAVIDWGFTLAVPPAYDLACVAANVTAGPWSVHPETPDRGERLRTTLLEAYDAHGDSSVVEAYHQHRPVYDLLCLVRATLHLPVTMADADGRDRRLVADAYRNRIRSAVGDGK